jgi:transcriptional regulator with XRE-family HTH domain
MANKEVPEQHVKRLEYIGIYLRELRFSEGLTQNELSLQANLHRNTIVRAENAKNMTLLSLFELADALEISPKELLDIA